MASELEIRQLHTLPTIVWQVVDENGCPVDLTQTEYGEATKITFSMVMNNRDRSPVLIETNANFLDKTKGLLEYKWTKYDTMFTGWYYAYFSVYFNDIINEGTKASVTYEGVTYEALEIGDGANGLVLSFDGNKNIAEVVSAFNTTNPDWNITHNAPDDTVVPSVGNVTLTGGTNTIILEKKKSYPDIMEGLEVEIIDLYGNASAFNPPAPDTPEIDDWLQERFREDFVPIGNMDGNNRVFTTYPYFFTVNQSFTVKVKFNGSTLVRGVDYNVSSTDNTKLGYNQIIFENDFEAPNSADGDSLLFDFYISDRE